MLIHNLTRSEGVSALPYTPAIHSSVSAIIRKMPKMANPRAKSQMTLRRWNSSLRLASRYPTLSSFLCFLGGACLPAAPGASAGGVWASSCVYIWKPPLRPTSGMLGLSTMELILWSSDDRASAATGIADASLDVWPQCQHQRLRKVKYRQATSRKSHYLECESPGSLMSAMPVF